MDEHQDSSAWCFSNGSGDFSGEGGTRRAGTCRRLDFEVYSPLDADLVSQLQELVFLAHAKTRAELLAVNLPPQEIAILGNALPHFVNLRRLRIHNSSRHSFGASIVALARGLVCLRPEKLIQLVVSGDGI